MGLPLNNNARRRTRLQQISKQEFEWLPLRVHDFLAGVPLHDVWAIDLPRARSGITLDEFLKTTNSRCLRPSFVVSALLRIRLAVGRICGWDREPATPAWQSFAARMTPEDRVKSLAPAARIVKARMLGGTIIAVDLSDYRLHFAKRLGADHGINAGKVAKTERLRMIKEWTHGRGADVVIECAGVPQAVPEALEMLRVGGLLVEAGNFSDLGEVSLSPHRHVCAKNARILAVGGEEPAAYGPSMRQMARYMKHYPLREFVTHRFGLRDVEAAMQNRSKQNP